MWVMSQARSVGILGTAGMLASLATGAGARGQGDAHKIGSPDVASATEISYPVNTTTTGMVALLMTIDASGSAQSTLVQQDVPPLTAAAQSGVQNWEFTAGSVHGKAVEMLLPVYIVFNPYNPAGTALVAGGPNVPQAMSPTGGSAVPPQIRLASYAMYPENTLATGTVVLSVNINKWGHTMQIKVVHGVHPLTDAAVAVVKQWGFQPATLGGARVAGRICIAFVFQRNLG
jgi:TonB family protein